ncbi:MAG: DUF6644 family protein [Hyphomicrobium sp.]
MEDPLPDPFWDPIAQSGLATFIGQSVWAYPALETLHVLGLALVFGPILIFDLRVFGFNRGLDMRPLHAALIPWAWTGFALNAASGGLLFISDAAAFAINPAFRIKLTLIALAGLNALAFQARLFPRLPDDDRGDPHISAKVSAAASIALWLAIITAGRLMAYVK